jgi:hypothetical protein
VAIIGIARFSQHAHHEVVSIGGCHAHLDPELVLLVCLAFGNAFDVREL